MRLLFQQEPRLGDVDALEAAGLLAHMVYSLENEDLIERTAKAIQAGAWAEVPHADEGDVAKDDFAEWYLVQRRGGSHVIVQVLLFFEPLMHEGVKLVREVSVEETSAARAAVKEWIAL